LIGSVSTSIGTIFSTTLSGIFSLLLVILCMFYLLKDGKQWKDMLVSISPLSDDASHAIIVKMTSAVNGIIRGYLLVGVIQGLLVSIGMYIFGVPHAALWGTLAGIASLIPSIGTALVSVPTVIFLLAAGQTGAAIGYGIWAAVLVGSIDNILSPFIVGRSVAIHPLLVLFSVLGGIALMGPVGILIGPLVICFIYTLMSVYKTEVV
jgi:predicted PurR-regulated permease PerM